MSRIPITRLYLFDNSGLQVILEFNNGDIRIITDWESEKSIMGMWITSKLMRLAKHNKYITLKNYVSYLNNKYFLVAEIPSEKYAGSALGLLRRISSTIERQVFVTVEDLGRGVLKSTLELYNNYKL